MTWKNEDDSPHWIGDITGQFKSAALDIQVPRPERELEEDETNNDLLRILVLGHHPAIPRKTFEWHPVAPVVSTMRTAAFLPDEAQDALILFHLEVSRSLLNGRRPPVRVRSLAA